MKKLALGQIPEHKIQKFITVRGRGKEGEREREREREREGEGGGARERGKEEGREIDGSRLTHPYCVVSVHPLVLLSV